MKKLLYLGIILILASCSSNESESTELNEYEEPVNMSKGVISTLIIGNLEVMPIDIGKGHYNDYMEVCEKLGNGWRLPTKDELNFLFKNKFQLGRYNSSYWSSTPVTDKDNHRWSQNFNYGTQEPEDARFERLGIRPVRSL